MGLFNRFFSTQEKFTATAIRGDNTYQFHNNIYTVDSKLIDEVTRNEMEWEAAKIETDSLINFTTNPIYGEYLQRYLKDLLLRSRLVFTMVDTQETIVFQPERAGKIFLLYLESYFGSKFVEMRQQQNNVAGNELAKDIISTFIIPVIFIYRRHIIERFTVTMNDVLTYNNNPVYTVDCKLIESIKTIQSHDWESAQIGSIDYTSNPVYGKYLQKYLKDGLLRSKLVFTMVDTHETIEFQPKRAEKKFLHYLESFFASLFVITRNHATDVDNDHFAMNLITGFIIPVLFIYRRHIIGRVDRVKNTILNVGNHVVRWVLSFIATAASRFVHIFYLLSVLMYFFARDAFVYLTKILALVGIVRPSAVLVEYSAIGLISCPFIKHCKISKLECYEHDVPNMNVPSEQSPPTKLFINATILASLARLSYEPEKTIKKILNDTWNIKLGSCTSIDNLPIIDPNAKWLDNYNFFYYHNTSYARAFILATKKSIVVVFRGTEPFNMFEWFTDSLFKMRPLGTTSLIQYQHVLKEDLKVSMAHRGFLDALEVFDFSNNSKCCFFELYSCLVKLIKQKPREIYICGHSLGGALANIFAFMMNGIYQHSQPKYTSQEENTSQEEKALNLDTYLGGLYTFGAPRVFNIAAKNEFLQCNALSKKTFRFVMDNDVVTQVPNYKKSDDSISRTKDTVEHPGAYARSSAQKLYSQFYHDGDVNTYVNSQQVSMEPEKDFNFPHNPLTTIMHQFLTRMTNENEPRPYYHVGNAIRFKKSEDINSQYTIETIESRKWNIDPVTLVLGELPKFRSFVIDNIGRYCPYILDHMPDGYEVCCKRFAQSVAPWKFGNEDSESSIVCASSEP